MLFFCLSRGRAPWSGGGRCSPIFSLLLLLMVGTVVFHLNSSLSAELSLTRLWRTNNSVKTSEGCSVSVTHTHTHTHLYRTGSSGYWTRTQNLDQQQWDTDRTISTDKLQVHYCPLHVPHVQTFSLLFPQCIFCTAVPLQAVYCCCMCVLSTAPPRSPQTSASSPTRCNTVLSSTSRTDVGKRSPSWF